ERRINLNVQSETFTVAQLRALLGVPRNKLGRFADFNKYALKPAVAEINQLTDYAVSVAIRKRGRLVHELVLMWFKKEPAAVKRAAAERQSSRVGRTARQRDKVEIIV